MDAIPQGLREQSDTKNGQFICFFSKSSAFVLLQAARDFIHLGWRLLHHPLYGNFRPGQQPYRSLLLTFDGHAIDRQCGFERILPDVASLSLIEEALLVYGSGPVLDLASTPTSLATACALLDYELMRLPLRQAGWPFGAES